MNDQELRLECLRFAKQNTGPLYQKEERLIEAAEKFYRFLRHQQEPKQPHTDQQEKEGHPSLDALSKKLIVFPLTPEQHALLSQLLK